MSDLFGASLDTSSVSSAMARCSCLGRSKTSTTFVDFSSRAVSLVSLLVATPSSRPDVDNWEGVSPPVPRAQAYLADVVPSERLPRFMVLREASATLAFIIGPTVGGFLTMDPWGGQDGECYHVYLLMVSRGFNSCY